MHSGVEQIIQIITVLSFIHGQVGQSNIRKGKGAG